MVKHPDNDEHDRKSEKRPGDSENDPVQMEYLPVRSHSVLVLVNEFEVSEVPSSVSAVLYFEFVERRADEKLRGSVDEETREERSDEQSHS